MKYLLSIVINLKSYKKQNNTGKVNMRVNCYGREEDTESIFFVDEWETAQQKGYYMA